MSYIIPVVLCGGAGTRLWPVSRDSLPKQFASLFERSTFTEALLRVRDRDLFGDPVVVTSEAYRFLVREQMHHHHAQGAILLEPCRRDSAAAIGAAATFIGADARDGLMLVLAADHRIEDSDAFVAAVRLGMEAAHSGEIVTFGIQPTEPATSYGYIRPGSPIGVGVHRVAAFVEKPDSKTASRYIEEGYLWNSGIFLARADLFLEELGRFAPSIAEAVTHSVAQATRDMDFVRLDAKAFAASPASSIDYAVMEKTARAAVVPVSFQWSDLGTWDAVWTLSSKDESGNAGQGPATFVEASDCYAWSDGADIAITGVHNIAVIATPDAILVAPRSATDQIKSVVDRLQKAGKSIATRHARDFRPWGNYQSVDRGERYQVKRIVVQPHGKLSLQMHHHRSEHWIVVRGTARVTINEDVRLIHENQSVFIPQGATHRLENPGKIPLELIEVQTGSYLGEDDIVRFEDVYGRSGET